MKRIYLLAISCLCCLFAFTQLMAQDTVSISIRNADKTYYLTANGNNAVTTYTTPAYASLWVITKNGNQVSFKNVSNGRNLYVNASGNSASMSLAQNASNFTFPYDATKNASSGNMYYYNRRNYYLYLNNNTLALSRNSQPTVYVEKWQSHQEISIGGTFSPSTTVFDYAEDNAAAQAQSINVTFKPSARKKTYISCLNNLYEHQRINENTTSIELNDIDVNFFWASHAGQADETTNKESRIIPADYTNTPAPSADLMMTMGEVGKEGDAYAFVITPNGPSPRDLMQLDDQTGVQKYVNYVDRVMARMTWNEKDYLTTLRLVRKSFHAKAVEPYTMTLTPPAYTFPSIGESIVVQVDCWHRHGEGLYDADGNPVPGSGTVTWEEKVNLLNPQTGYIVSIKAIDWTTDNFSEWLQAEVVGENTVRLTALQNESSERYARFSCTVDYQDPSDVTHKYSARVQPRMRQLGQNSGDGCVAFIPNKGKGNMAELQAGERQPVHMVEKVIYYLPGEDVELRLNEQAFFGYMRWYDYTTNGNPFYNTDAEGKATWSVYPRGSGGQFVDFNNSDCSIGLFGFGTIVPGITTTAILTSANLNSNATAPRIKFSDGKSHTVACDVSNYTDYVYTPENGEENASFKEPTLSYRQLFHLRPAAEMAAELDVCKGDKFLEVHNYTAPIGTTVHLITNHPFIQKNHISECCYFYDAANPKRVPAAEVQCRELGGNNITLSDNGNMLVSSNTIGTKTYTVTWNGYNIAKYVVTYVDPSVYGPTTNTLISGRQIEENYILLTKQDFNFGQKPASAATEYLDRHLPWEDVTYGYAYQNTPPSDQRHTAGEFPFYGEYCLVNATDKSWAKGESHDGAANGYMLYVDGTMEPGLVVSISTDEVICSGQQMYCSLWLNNPCPADNNEGSNPIFRCNVQGRRTGGQWEDVGVFFVGELPKASGWRQIRFPITSAENYDESRVSIYNFSNTNSGNDFYVDDVYLYATQLPITAYQATSACHSDNKSTAVMRLDYGNLLPAVTANSEYLYYQIYNTTTSTVLELMDDLGNSAYYHEDPNHATQNTYGSILFPDVDYVPTGNNVPIVTSVVDFINSIDVNHKGKAYIKTEVDGKEKWMLYIAHVVTGLEARNEYIVRMATSPDDLEQVECAMQSALPVMKATHLRFKGETDDLQAPSLDNCPNQRYAVEAVAVNSIAASAGATPQQVEALLMSDWLIGFEFDCPYGKDRVYTAEEKAQADESFLQKYGYDRNHVTTAIYDMRRIPTPDDSNPNYTATSVDELQKEAFSSQHHYDMIVDLCNKGYLTLSINTMPLILPSEMSLRYWVFPISGTAKVTMKDASDQDVTITLEDCNEPIWMDVRSKKAEAILNVAPLDYTQMTDAQRAEIPKTRVLASQVNKGFKTPVSDFGGVVLGWDSTCYYSTNDPVMLEKRRTNPTGFSLYYYHDRVVQDNIRPDNDPLKKEYYSKNDSILFRPIDQAHVNEMMYRHDHPLPGDPNEGWPDNQPGYWVINTDTMRPGYEYTLRNRLLGTDLALQGDGDVCGHGYIYFTVVAVPDTMIWTPSNDVYNDWSDDANWRGVVHGKVMEWGYVPLQGTKVIIPKQDNPLKYPIITGDNPKPMDAYFATQHGRDIHFEEGSFVMNQHKLNYRNAFVDMVVPTETWHSMAVPLKDVYSGDMFVPHATNDWSGATQESEEHFAVSDFKGYRSGEAPFAFWLSYYNRMVDYLHKDERLQVISTNTEAFKVSNALNEPLVPGQGYQMLAFGPTAETELIVRLPKPDNQYEYYRRDGTPTGKVDMLDSRVNANRLAFEPDESGCMKITLTNEQASNKFMFGNPTMAYIDMKQFLADNSDVLNANCSYLISSAWQVATTATMAIDDRYLPPMYSVLLEAKTPATEITLNLKVSHTTLDLSGDDITPSPAPRADKRMAPRANNTAVMTICVANEWAHARSKLAVDEAAQNAFVLNEDVLFFSSGVEAEQDDATATTPMNLYTVHNQVPMMVDVRKSIQKIPVGMLLAEDYRTDSVEMAFYLTPNWQKTCYLYDAETETYERIGDGRVLKIATPLNHTPRYYITCGDVEDEPDSPNTDLREETIVDDVPSAQLYVTNDAQNVLTVRCTEPLRELALYDVMGRLLCKKTLALAASNLRLEAPTGVLVVKATTHDGRELVTHALVQ